MVTNSVDAPSYPASAAVPAKPKLRGWLHAVMAPLAAVGGTLLVIAAQTPLQRIGMTVFAITATLLFGVSALYHRFSWAEPARLALKRIDHADIFFVIAGTYTAFAVTLLDTARASQLLIIMWAATLVCSVTHIAWVGAPRWLTTPIYIGLGWVAMFYIKPFYDGGGPVVLALIVTGGVLYTIGGVIYGLKRPNPLPRWFGFHEIFHAFTVLAFLSHFAAAAIATLSWPALAS